MNIYLLWEEYENGIGGRKPEILFTREEQGRVKHKHYQRKIVWDCVATLVRAGINSQVAIDDVYQVYGESTNVTQITNSMRQYY